MEKQELSIYCGALRESRITALRFTIAGIRRDLLAIETAIETTETERLLQYVNHLHQIRKQVQSVVSAN